MHEVTAMKHPQQQLSGERHIARVLEAERGEALQVEIGYTVLPVCAHVDSVGWVDTGDRVLVDLLEEGVVVSGRLRPPRCNGLVGR